MGITDILDKFETYLNTNTSLAPASKSKYGRIVRSFLMTIHEKKAAFAFNIEDINKFIFKKTRGRKRGNNTKYALKAFLLSIGKKHWVFDLLPIKTKPRQKKFPYFSPEIMRRIIDNLDMPYKAIAFIQAHTGARFREAATIKIEDISKEKHEKLIFIWVSNYAKGQKARNLNIRKEHETSLNTLIKDKTYGYLILDDKYNNMTDEEIDRKLEILLRYYNGKLNTIGLEYGISRLSSHYIRHHYADTFMMKPGADIYKLRHALGHSRIETSKEYVSVGDKITTDFLAKDDSFM